MFDNVAKMMAEALGDLLGTQAALNASQQNASAYQQFNAQQARMAQQAALSDLERLKARQQAPPERRLIGHGRYREPIYSISCTVTVTELDPLPPPSPRPR